ncbi:MAG: DUF4388 domain-containing protein [bacterium]|nr:DUF4388 domain-containing protein [bacterium]
MQIFFEQEGKLEDVFVGRVLKSLFDQGETGMLSLEGNGARKSVYFNQGQIVFAASNCKNDWLGTFLFRSGKLSYEAFERSSGLMAPNRRHGEILVELGMITPETLKWGVKEQVQEIVMSLFLWASGRYSFISMNPLSSEAITLKPRTLDLILEGSRRVNHWGVIQAETGSPNTGYRRCDDAPSLLKKLYLKPKEKEVLQSLGEPQSIREICRSLSMNDFLICRILMGLLLVGLLEIAPCPVEV